ncbi:MAG: YqgE/AlgH family protein [Bacteroidetes bacterium]|nr:MAG: YqgE/AlgH family protein [Bacteroidota bacterium]
MIFDKELNDSLAIKQGYLILSEPFLPDSNFERAVILICEHSTSGTFGLVINKATDLILSEVTDFQYDAVIFNGGPVELNSLHFIHTFSEIDGCVALKDGVYWGGDYRQIQTYALLGKLTPTNCRFFVGYTGWGEHQLHSELKKNSWIISTFELQKIFDVAADELWREILRSMGGRYKVFSNFPTNPQMN